MTQLTGMRAYARDLATHIPSRGERRRLLKRMRAQQAAAKRRASTFEADPSYRCPVRVKVRSNNTGRKVFRQDTIGRINNRAVAKGRTRREEAELIRTAAGREILRSTGHGDKKARTAGGFAVRFFGTHRWRRQVQAEQRQTKAEENATREAVVAARAVDVKRSWLRDFKSWLGGGK